MHFIIKLKTEFFKYFIIFYFELFAEEICPPKRPTTSCEEKENNGLAGWYSESVEEVYQDRRKRSGEGNDKHGLRALSQTRHDKGINNEP